MTYLQLELLKAMAALGIVGLALVVPWQAYDPSGVQRLRGTPPSTGVTLPRNKTVVICADNSDYWVRGAKALFARTFADRGLAIVGSESVASAGDAVLIYVGSYETPVSRCLNRPEFASAYAEFEGQYAGPSRGGTGYHASYLYNSVDTFHSELRATVAVYSGNADDVRSKLLPALFGVSSIVQQQR